MKLSDFDYHLPKKLIAQSPLKKRDASRLLVLDRKSGELKHEQFKNIDKYFNGNEVLVRNSTKVIPARLFGRKISGALIELLLVKRLSEGRGVLRYECLAKPARRLKIRDRIIFKEGILEAEVSDKNEGGIIVNFIYQGIFEEILNELGEMPLPKYIKEKLQDKERYQTIYAKEGNSSAAPTAGLHFSEEVFKKLQAKGVEILDINLDVGLGTFAPVREEDTSKHKMHSESYSITESVAKKINDAKKDRRPIVALGTTSLRALESAWTKKDKLRHGNFETDIFIKPGYEFKVVDSLITNFHLPKSTLIMLVSALAGRENILRAYNEAVKEKYRFFSFGDAMFIK